ncbi:hypothetical protein GCM10007989_02200 [Devosia pacifica]|uniref:Uncharacterized protein n=1 Tax=Devosia pacifica TaxID=1335967 RepID=A0A918RUZ7_9HYPH|nr:hypothetical protein GCM10007989_02200 [Devosia pacifica]
MTIYVQIERHRLIECGIDHADAPPAVDRRRWHVHQQVERHRLLTLSRGEKTTQQAVQLRSYSLERLKRTKQRVECLRAWHDSMVPEILSAFSVAGVTVQFRACC